jgi:hypothetical protein
LALGAVPPSTITRQACTAWLNPAKSSTGAWAWVGEARAAAAAAARTNERMA